MFDAESPYARLLGREMTDFLMEQHVMGDFLGVFIAPDGRLIEPYAPSDHRPACGTTWYTGTSTSTLTLSGPRSANAFPSSRRKSKPRWVAILRFKLSHGTGGTAGSPTSYTQMGMDVRP